MTFGMNKHLQHPKISDVYSEITGRRVGRVVEHGDGRQDAVAKSEPVYVSPERIEEYMPLNDLRRLLYDMKRKQGKSHYQAVHELFPNGKVLA